MKKKVFRERRMKVVVLGTEKPVIPEYNPETTLTLDQSAPVFNVTDEDMKPVEAFEKVKERVRPKRTKKVEK